MGLLYHYVLFLLVFDFFFCYSYESCLFLLLFSWRLSGLSKISPVIVMANLLAVSPPVCRSFFVAIFLSWFIQDLSLSPDYPSEISHFERRFVLIFLLLSSLFHSVCSWDCLATVLLSVMNFIMFSSVALYSFSNRFSQAYNSTSDLKSLMALCFRIWNSISLLNFTDWIFLGINGSSFSNSFL